MKVSSSINLREHKLSIRKMAFPAKHLLLKFRSRLLSLSQARLDYFNPDKCLLKLQGLLIPNLSASFKILKSKGHSSLHTVAHPIHFPYNGRRTWQPTPVFLPGKFHGWRSLVGYSPWGRKESERLHFLSHTVMRCMGCDPAMSYRLGGHE